MNHQIRHMRTSKYGRNFIAGKKNPRYVLQANGISTIHNNLESALFFKKQLISEGFKFEQIRIVREEKLRRKFEG